MVTHRIRAFNRFYTRKIGLITNRFLNSDYSLLQARVLFELTHTPPVYASDLARKLGLAPDYLSKVISKFETLGLITRTPSPLDARKQILSPTPAGQTAYAELKERSNIHIGEMITPLSPEDTQNLVVAMDTIEQILDPKKKPAQMVTIRSHRPGDIGMVIHRHGLLYANEYGFNHEFDAYVALGMARFIQSLTGEEHLWIAEVQARFAGSVAVVRRDGGTAQLRWLIVEPGHRKMGIGRQLVDQAIQFSREKGYNTLILWTIDFLHPARHIYAKAGFRKTETKVSRVWGKTLTEECWTLNLK